MAFDSPPSLVLMPPEDSPQYGEMLDLSFALGESAARLASSLHPAVRAEVGKLVRTMNCYYTNLIEGHHTLPRDIDRAMANDFSQERAKRNLQLEARAHIEVQALIDSGNLDGLGFGREFVRTVHREFCDRLPSDLLAVENPTTKERIAVVPGEWRTRNVAVGAHQPVAPDMVEAFMLRFEDGYDQKRIGRALRPIAAAASHHRLVWIHPFLDDNGRVARLHSHAYLRGAGVGSELWSVARGLARTVTEYKERLARADLPPQGMLDGRGTLSDSHLADFVRYFLIVSTDQAEFMRGLLEPAAVVQRIRQFVAKEAEAKRIDARVSPLLERLVIEGEVNRAAVPRLLGVAERQTRRLLAPLIRRRLIVADTLRGPVRIGFPSAESDSFFPRLFAPGDEQPRSNPTPQI